MTDATGMDAARAALQQAEMILDERQAGSERAMRLAMQIELLPYRRLQRELSNERTDQ